MSEDRRQEIERHIRDFSILTAKAREMDELIDEFRKKYLEALRMENMPYR